MNYQPGDKVIIKDFDSDMEVEASVEGVDGEYLELSPAGADMFDMPVRLHQKDIIRKSGHRVYLIDEALINDDRSIFGVAAGDSVLVHKNGCDYPAKVAHVNVDGHVDVIPTGEWPRGMYTDGIDLATVRTVVATKKDDPYSSVGNMIGTANSTINDLLEMFESFNLDPINTAEEHLRSAKQALMEAMPMVDKFVGASKTASERWDDIGVGSSGTEFISGDQVSFTENGQQYTGTISEIKEIGGDEAALTIAGDDGSYHRNIPAGSAQKIAQFGWNEPWKDEDLEKDEKYSAYDETEDYRRQEKQELDSFAGEREQLESEYGQVWDTSELQQDFSVEGFMAPYVVVTRLADGQKGSLMFQSSPRYYFNFSPQY